MSSAPTVGLSAVVVTYRSGPLLERALESLLAAGADEAIVVDNGSDAEEEARLARFAETRPIAIVRGQGNVGFGRACNLGARRAAGRVIAFSNSDLEARPGALKALAAALEGARPPAIVGARLFGKDGREQRGSRRDLYSPWNVAVAFLGLGRLERLSALFRDPHRERDPSPAAPIRVGAVSGALFAMRREDFAALGGFDEGYFLHVEDVDLCRRAHEAGGDVLFVPGAEALHVGGASRASRARVELAKARSFARYFGKFARGPVERVAALAMGPLLAPALLLNGALKGRRTPR